MTTIRMASAALLAAMVLAVPAHPSLASNDRTTCRVRNVTQDTRGGSFRRMVEAADDGDRLRVRGICVGGVVIDKDLMIIGAGFTPTLHGRDRHRVLRVTTDATVTLRHLRISHGLADGGAAILSRGDLTLVDTIVQRNEGFNGGGAIQSWGSLHLNDSIVRRNVGWGAAGIMIVDGTATITASTVTRNRAIDQGAGGGIVNYATLTVVDSVVSRNDADFGGGAGIVNHGVLTLTDTRVSRNRARSYDDDFGGGGGIQNSGQLTLIDSSVTGNSIGGPTGGGGGGIFNWPEQGMVSLQGTSGVTGNTPDDCAGTPAC